MPAVTPPVTVITPAGTPGPERAAPPIDPLTAPYEQLFAASAVAPVEPFDAYDRVGAEDRFDPPVPGRVDAPAAGRSAPPDDDDLFGPAATTLLPPYDPYSTPPPGGPPSAAPTSAPRASGAPGAPAAPGPRPARPARSAGDDGSSAGPALDRRAVFALGLGGAVASTAAAVVIGPGHGLGLVGSDRRPAPPGPAPVAMPAGATRGRTEYQGSTGGKAPKPSTAPLKQPPTVLTLDPALHLARRASWGLTPALAKEVKKGTSGWLAAQLDPESIDDAACDRLLERFDTLGASPAKLRAMNDSRQGMDYFYAHTELELAAIIRAVWSKRQLFEVTVDFLHSRVHVPAHFDKSRDTLNDYDQNVVRKHAFGKFGDLLQAAVTHPAMILYLDNQQNTRRGGNQNLGRELLELHTLGVDAGYKQADVEAAAQVLTGLTVDDQTLETEFRSRDHYVGAVTVFGKKYSNSRSSGGMKTIQAMVHDLARHPKTAEYFALDLARRFVADAPPLTLVKRLAAIYLKEDTAIVPMLRAIFTSEEFAVSVGQKYRRPLESTVASVRALGITPGKDDKLVETLGNLRYNLEAMGQAPLGHTAPDGYADFAEPWLSSIGTLARWNMSMALSGRWMEGFAAPDVDEMLSGCRTYGDAVDALAGRLLFQKPDKALRATLLDFLDRTSRSRLSSAARRQDYNLRVRVPALILGAPHHQLR